jgi:hypothetical protein
LSDDVFALSHTVQTLGPHAAVYLASDEAGFFHGTVIDVDGGRRGVAFIATASDDRA